MTTSMKKGPDFSIYMQATKIGSGVWFMNHLKSFKGLTSEERIKSLKEDIDLLRVYFSCGNCREHLNNFCKLHPPELAMEDDITDFRDNIRPENLAKWLVDAHNEASKEKFKWMSQREEIKFSPDIINYEDVRYFFDNLGQMPCEKDCDKLEVTVKTEIKSAKLVASKPNFVQEEVTTSSSKREKRKPRIKVVSGFD
jgi:hypothetical protein